MAADAYDPNPGGLQPRTLRLAGSERRPLPGAVAKGRTNPNAVLEVTLKLRRGKPLPPIRPGAEPISREELAGYGASQADIDAVVETFGKLGLKAVDQNPAGRSLRLSGPVKAMEKAFGVRLFDYAHEGGGYRGRVGPILLPRPVKDIVVGVFGLDNRRVARRRRHPVSDAAHPLAGSAQSSWYTGAQLAQHYNFPPGDGSGQTIGLLEFGGGYFAQDLAKFSSITGMPAPPQVLAVSTDGTATDSHDGEEGEVMLDVEVVASACPKARIVAYFAQWTEQGWITILDHVLQDKTNSPGVVSISWGYAEDADIWTVQAMTQVNESLKEAALLGITVCVAAGDDGSSDAVSDGHAHADFPSSSPLALAVGGTTIPAGGAGGPDIVWKEGDGLRADNGGSTGGGVSTVFPVPDWQKAVAVASVNPGAPAGRCVPDLAANADWTASPYLLVVDGKAQPNGGTSAASPLVASLVARINAQRGKPVGYLTPLLYQPPSGGGSGVVGQAACTDVTSGDNITSAAGGYSAGKGYDAVSGWGTPDGAKLAAALS